MIKRWLVFIFGIVTISMLSAEYIRVSVPYNITLSSADPDGETFRIKYNEAIGLQIAPNDMFLQGIEIEIKITKEMLPYISSLGWTIYSKVTPSFSKTRFDYEGTQLFFQPFPERISLVLQIPVDKNHTLKTTTFATVLPFIATSDKTPLLFAFFMLGKGVNNEIEKGYFNITVRPILKNEGALTFYFSPPAVDLKNISVFIDDNKYSVLDRPIYLKKGTYTVRISAEGYREEIYTVNILPAQTTSLQVTFSSAIPHLVFSLPDNAIVLINGKVIDWLSGSYELEPGEYTITIKIGDYLISRKVLFIAGKKYTISLEMNLIIEASP